MKIQLILLDNPIIVTDERVGDVNPEYYYNAKDKDWYKYSPDLYDDLEKEDRPIIAGIEGLPSINWNDLEEEFGFINNKQVL